MKNHVAEKTENKQALDILKHYIEDGYSVLVCGGAGDGRTTLLQWIADHTSGYSLIAQKYSEIYKCNSDNIASQDYDFIQSSFFHALNQYKDKYANIILGDLSDKTCILFCISEVPVYGDTHINRANLALAKILGNHHQTMQWLENVLDKRLLIVNIYDLKIKSVSEVSGWCYKDDTAILKIIYGTEMPKFTFGSY